MEIKVFGPGCSKCNEAEAIMKEVVAERGIDATITKVSDFKEMMALGIMSTPAVSVDGKVKCVGKIPTKAEANTWLMG